MATARSAYRRVRPRFAGRKPTPARTWVRLSGLAVAVAGVDQQVLPFYILTTTRMRRALRRAANRLGVPDHELVGRALRAFLREGGA